MPVNWIWRSEPCRSTRRTRPWPRRRPSSRRREPALTSLASRVQQAQAERVALDALSQALGHVSAAQPAADAIQQGDFSAAKQQLANLGEEADQLSDAAKQQLASALQQAANTTGQPTASWPTASGRLRRR